MYVNSSATHRREKPPLVEIADYRVWVEELRWASQIIAVRLLSPAAHRAPCRALQLEAACLIGHVNNTISYVVQFSILIKAPNLYVKLRPILSDWRFVLTLTILARFGNWSESRRDVPTRRILHHRNMRCVSAVRFASRTAVTSSQLHTLSSLRQTGHLNRWGNRFHPRSAQWRRSPTCNPPSFSVCCSHSPPCSWESNLHAPTHYSFLNLN